MGASIDGIPMRLNPTSISWPYTMKIADQRTLGGKVIQLLGVTLGDLTVEGTFGVGGFEEQQAFFDRIVNYMDTQMPLKGNPSPLHFLWPERGWDFWCFVRSMTQQGAQTAIRADNKTFAPGFVLTLFIQEDNGDLIRAVKTSAAAAFIGRLTAGLGWKQTAFNGPTGAEEVSAVLSGRTIFQALNDPEWLSSLAAQQQSDIAAERERALGITNTVEEP
jgi:hypothetical protein